MNDSVIKTILKSISKKYSLHLEKCFKGDVGYIEEIYFSEDSIKRGGLDICNYLENLFGLLEVESKMLVEKWVKDKINVDECGYDINKIWFKTTLNNYFNDFSITLTGVTGVTGVTIVY